MTVSLPMKPKPPVTKMVCMIYLSSLGAFLLDEGLESFVFPFLQRLARRFD
jgi:hypothetical protein